MKNTFEIIKHHETCGDKFFTVAITNLDGTHTDIFSEATLIEVIRRNKQLAVNMDDEDLVNELSQLAYITIAEDETNIFDVYLHEIEVDDFITVDFGGKHLKEYKSEKAALNFANKQGCPVFN